MGEMYLRVDALCLSGKWTSDAARKIQPNTEALLTGTVLPWQPLRL